MCVHACQGACTRRPVCRLYFLLQVDAPLHGAADGHRRYVCEVTLLTRDAGGNLCDRGEAEVTPRRFTREHASAPACVHHL